MSRIVPQGGAAVQSGGGGRDRRPGSQAELATGPSQAEGDRADAGRARAALQVCVCFATSKGETRGEENHGVLYSPLVALGFRRLVERP